MKKDIIKFVLSVFVFVSIISITNNVSALTASDISMLLNAGIITQTQADSLTNSINNATAPSDIVPSNVCISLQNSMFYGTKDSSVNGEVSILQDFLQANNYLSNNPTGFYGLMTINAIKAFQSDHNIIPTGYVGPLTRAQIASLTCGNTTGQTSTSTISTTPACVPLGGNLGAVYPGNNAQCCAGLIQQLPNNNIIGGRGTCVQNNNGNLSVSLSSGSPVATTVTAGQTKVDLADFTFTNPTANTIVIGYIEAVTQGNTTSSSDKSPLNNVYAYINTTDSNRSTSGIITSINTELSTPGSDAGKIFPYLGITSVGQVIKFVNNSSGIFSIPARSSVTIQIKADTDSSITNTQSLSLSLIDAMTNNLQDGNKITTPIQGGIITVTPSISLAPIITSISPTSGPVGTLITVNGSNFQFMNQSIGGVNIGNHIIGNNISAGGYSLYSSNELTFRVPPLPTGTYPVQLDTTSGNSNSVNFIVTPSISLAPIITSISPTSGPSDITVTIYGSFSMIKDNPSSVGLCTTPSLDNCNYSSARIISMDSSSITVVVENSYEYPLAPRTYYLIVAFQDGSIKSNAVNFTFISATPVPILTSSIISITPQSGGANAAITIFGKNMNNASSVNFYDNSGSLIGSLTPFFSDINNAEVNISPNFAESTTPGTYNVKVVTPLGITNSLPFTLINSPHACPMFTPPAPNFCSGGTIVPRGTINGCPQPPTCIPAIVAAPTITSISPASGSSGGVVTINGSNGSSGTLVTINGSNFSGNGDKGISVNLLNINDPYGTNYSSPVTLINSSMLNFTVPNGVPSGTYNVSVSADGGQSNTVMFTIATSTVMAAPENSNVATVLNALSIKDLIMIVKILTGQK